MEERLENFVNLLNQQRKARPVPPELAKLPNWAQRELLKKASANGTKKSEINGVALQPGAATTEPANGKHHDAAPKPEIAIAAKAQPALDAGKAEPPKELPAKPVDVKPAEAKCADAKPAEIKPVDVKPAEARSDAKPAGATEASMPEARIADKLRDPQSLLAKFLAEETARTEGARPTRPPKRPIVIDVKAEPVEPVPSISDKLADKLAEKFGQQSVAKLPAPDSKAVDKKPDGKEKIAAAAIGAAGDKVAPPLAVGGEIVPLQPVQPAIAEALAPRAARRPMAYALAAAAVIAVVAIVAGAYWYTRDDMTGIATHKTTKPIAVATKPPQAATKPIVTAEKPKTATPTPTPKIADATPAPKAATPAPKAVTPAPAIAEAKPSPPPAVTTPAPAPKIAESKPATPAPTIQIAEAAPVPMLTPAPPPAPTIVLPIPTPTTPDTKSAVATKTPPPATAPTPSAEKPQAAPVSPQLAMLTPPPASPPASVAPPSSATPSPPAPSPETQSTAEQLPAVPAPKPAQAAWPSPPPSKPTPPPAKPVVTAAAPAAPAKQIASADEPTWLRNAVAAPPAAGQPRIAIVIDDLGLDRDRTSRAIALAAPVTLSFLAYASDLPKQTEAARHAGHELIVHVPMEPVVRPKFVSPNAGASSPAAQAELLRRLRWDLGRFSGYVGVNNHLGNRLSSDPDSTNTVIAELKARGLLFLDSRPGGAVLQVAAEQGVPSVTRDVLLDDDVAATSVKERLARLEKVARERGTAIAIGHPHDMTLEALQTWIAELPSKGLQLVPLTAIVKDRERHPTATN